MAFFEFVSLDPKENYGQVYIRVSDIDQLHRSFREAGVPLLPKEQPESKPWGSASSHCWTLITTS